MRDILRISIAAASCICNCQHLRLSLAKQIALATGRQAERQTETDRDGQTANSDAKLHGVRIINEQKKLKCKVQMPCDAVAANWWQLLNPRHWIVQLLHSL